MSASTAKRVLIRRFDRETLAGFVSQQNFVQSGGIEYLSVEGAAVLLPHAEVKSIHFVRDLAAPAAFPLRAAFVNRPRMGGIWVRLQFRDDDFLEGVLAPNLLQLDPHGFSVVPPDPGPNNQKVFVPRTALVEARVLGVIGAARIPRMKPQRPPVPAQIELFES